MLSDIVQRAVRQKARWCPATWDYRDMVQEAWVAVLEATASGEIDPDELQRRAELRLKRLMSRENGRNTSSFAELPEHE